MQGASIAEPMSPQPARPGVPGYLADDRLVNMVENWGLVVRRLRIVYGLTQERVGVIFGVSQRTVSRWERSESKPGADCRRRLRELEWELSEALSESPAPPEKPSPFSGRLAGGLNAGTQATAGTPEALRAHVPVALAERAIALLGCMSPEDIEQLPPDERRRLAEQCRRIAELAAQRNGQTVP
jgi:transcriptional regulator with XRE-family HTH domain